MHFRLDQRFDAPLDAVEAALLDPTVVEQLGALAPLGRPEVVRHRHEGSVVRREVRYAFVGELSPAVTAVVDPHRLTWVDVAVHDLVAHRSEHRIVPDHYRSRLTCEYVTRLAAEGDGTRRVAEGELRVHMPLVGGRVERAIVSGLAEHAAREQRALDEWLAMSRG